MALSERTRADLAKAERRQLIEAQGRDRKAAERREVGEGVAETVSLGEARGEAFEAPMAGRGERDKPIRRLSGIDTLHRAGKLTGGRLKAAMAYRDAWQAAACEPPLRSCLSDQLRGGDGPTIAMIGAAGRSRMLAANRLAVMRRHLGYHPDLVNVCDLILGQEKTPRECAANGSEAAVYTALVLVALDLMAVAEFAERAERTARSA